MAGGCSGGQLAEGLCSHASWAHILTPAFTRCDCLGAPAFLSVKWDNNSPLPVTPGKCPVSDHHGVEGLLHGRQSWERLCPDCAPAPLYPRRICLILNSSRPQVPPWVSGPTEQQWPRETVPSRGKDSSPWLDRPCAGCVTSGWGHSLSELQE